MTEAFDIFGFKGFIQKQLGQLDAFEFCGWDHAESSVWRLKTPSGVHYLKVHRRVGKFRQERSAYKEWLSEFERVPKLVAYTENPHALLLSEAKGELVEQLELSAPVLQDVYFQAGLFLGEFHALAFEDEDIALSEAMEKRFLSWVKRGEGILDAADVSWVKAQLRESFGLLDAYNRVPCHRDFTARNWLWDGEKLSVIDFEHCRADFFLNDLTKLHSDVFCKNPDLEASFFRGYGRNLSDSEKELLNALSAFGALTTIIWAREHNDLEFLRYGEEILERLRSVF